MLRVIALTLTSSLLLLTAPPVRADAIPDQPPCPAGATRVIDGHQVIYCRPDTCEADADCASGACRAAGLCVVAVTASIATSFPAMPGEPMREVSYRDARAVCSDGTPCASGACEMARRCAAPEAPASAAPAGDPPPNVPAAAPSSTPPRASSAATSDDDEGGCSAGAGARPGPLAVGLALVVFGVLCRRRATAR